MRSHVFPIGRFTDGIAHTLRRCGTDIREPDLANIADILLRVALGIIVFPTYRLDTSDPARARVRRPPSGPRHRQSRSLARVRLVGTLN